MSSTKSQFKLPQLSSLRRKRGPKVISTFSGAGGSSIGYLMAGCQVVLASEFVEAALTSYSTNFPGTPIDGRDIREVQPEEWLERLSLDRGELDILDGSPPCSAFSTNGRREKGWGEVKKYSDREQRVDDLFFEYARILKGLQPKVFLAENVKGLAMGGARNYLREIMTSLRGCGYRVGAKLLDAQWLGVPQARTRLIFVGVRNDLAGEPTFPTPFRWRYSVQEALSDIEGTVIPEPETELTERLLGRWQVAPVGGYAPGGFNVEMNKVDPTCPCPTVIAGQTGLARWDVPRRLAIDEVRRLCTFPSDYVLTGTYSQQWERLGRAVPPVMMSHVAMAVKGLL